VLVVNFGGEEEMHALRLAGRLRKRGVNTEVYFKAAKMKKQFSYADKNNINFVAIRGEDEIESDSISLKNMKTGDQETLPFEQALQKLQAEFVDD
jgi:histidyl-tRNA synthetase